MMCFPPDTKLRLFIGNRLAQKPSFLVRYTVASDICFCVFVNGFGMLPFTELRGERDEFADLVEDLKHAGVIGTQRRGLTLYKNSFSGIQLVDWLQTKKGMGKLGNRDF